MELASLAWLSCFSQNSNACSFSLTENMILKLHIVTHFDPIFLVIQFFLQLQKFKFFEIARRPLMNMVYWMEAQRRKGVSSG